jgi:hypothetical protein
MGLVIHLFPLKSTRCILFRSGLISNGLKSFVTKLVVPMGLDNAYYFSCFISRRAVGSMHFVALDFNPARLKDGTMQ